MYVFPIAVRERRAQSDGSASLYVLSVLRSHVQALSFCAPRSGDEPGAVRSAC